MPAFGGHFVLYIYIYTRRKDGAKAPSLLDHLELLFQTFDAKAMDLRIPISDANAHNLRNPISDANALDQIRRLG